MIKAKPIGILLIAISIHAHANELSDKPDLLAEGGRLYDKWWAEYDLKAPEYTHPSYPEAGKKKDSATWRCKECHGWDYKGVSGAYSKGSHFTGIKGVDNYAGESPEKIMNILKNKAHSYDTVMKDHGLLRIANFVSRGQIDISEHINPDTKKVNGDDSLGGQIYDEWCKSCHGSDGTKINFKNRSAPEYVGTVALKNPWEAMHKIRNGHPGAFMRGKPMPHMYGKKSLDEQLALLAYMQTLTE